MSLVMEVLERLSGIAIVREKLNDTAQRVDRVGTWLLDHERRIVRLEEREAQGSGDVEE
jgi:hypothetical protein